MAQTSTSNLQSRHNTTFISAKNHDPTTLQAFRQNNAFPVPAPQSAPRLKPSLIRPIPSKSTSTSTSTSSHAPAPTIGPYTQRALFPSTTTSTQHPYLSLSHPTYGLPPRLVSNLRSLGIASIYGWQASCLRGHGMLSGETNLVYTAPTGGGKSLVADVVMFKRVLEGRKALLVLPYVALVQEKLRWLRAAVEGVERGENEGDGMQGSQGSQRFRAVKAWERKGLRVAGFFGGSQTREGWADIDIAVCTIEKANALVNMAVEGKREGEIGVVVMDEMHMVDDMHRGYLLELMATKLLVLGGVQIVGMSATLRNTRELGNWLGGKYLESKYKPVPLEEFLVCDLNIYPVLVKEGIEGERAGAKVEILKEPVRMIDNSKESALCTTLENAVVSLAVETAQAGYGALVFCGSRAKCQTTADTIAQAMPTADEVGHEIMEKRHEVVATLRWLAMIPVDDALARTVPYGVAFHHAGLTTQERDAVAEAYGQGALKVIVATCSLAAGINLPARRVILHSARMGREMVGPAMLRQMRGRAGRKGKDEVGESYVCCRREDLEDVEELIAADLPPITSSLVPEKRGIKRALLEVIATDLAVSPEAIRDYITRTLLYHTTRLDNLQQMVDDAIDYLTGNCLIGWNAIDEIWAPTRLGSAIVAAGVSPSDGLLMHSELERALKSFVLDGDLHVFYLFSPYTPSSLGPIDWREFMARLERLDQSGERAMQLVGVSPGLVMRRTNSSVEGERLEDMPEEQIAKMLPYYRLYAALQLRDICNEVPLPNVAKAYNTTRGYLQSLLLSSQSVAGSAISFCTRMGWGMLAASLKHMCDRLLAGARADVLELARIPFVKSRTARILWENKYQNLRDVAEAHIEQLVDVLVLAQPSKNKTMGGNEEKYREKMRERAQIMMSWAARAWNKEREADVMDIDL
ncbi:MAG: hypothetical protein MMC23_005620 [Stictis urceolatum]|nr:hypothetical protein [Stictis urceolata]